MTTTNTNTNNATQSFYQGHTTITLDDNKMAEFYTNSEFNPNLLSTPLYENEYIGISTMDGVVRGKFKYHNGRLIPLPEKLTKQHFISNSYTGLYKPRNLEQEYAFDLLKDTSSGVKLLTGRFGTGKTLLLVIGALEALEKGKFDKIVWIRNNVQVKDTDPLGALPGTQLDKMLPYVGPMIDHVGGMEGIYQLINENKLEVLPLAYIRGRSIKRSIIICSEAENLTTKHIQLLLGRVDEGSNIWFDADIRQRDKVIFEHSQGIETLVERLKGNPLFGYVNLVKVERSDIAQLADCLD